MNSQPLPRVVVTGIGLVTPLGSSPSEVLPRVQAGESAAAAPTGFDAGVFACPVCAQVKDFDPQRYVAEPKMVRLMNRDAQLAVAAARLALEDAGVKPGSTYPPDLIGLFGATGLAGLPLREVVPLVRVSAGRDGAFDLTRFGQAGLKAVSPVLSFKILSNMPFCFVSINENIRGPNAIYTPWEGEGAQAVEAGIRALQSGDALCALVGACDVKTHELAFATLQQQGLFSGWEEDGKGHVPGEGAAFLVLETEHGASRRGARIYAHLALASLRSCSDPDQPAHTRLALLNRLPIRNFTTLVSSANGEGDRDRQEERSLAAAGVMAQQVLFPKRHVGELFAAAALVQLALGAALSEADSSNVLCLCFGHGSTQAIFTLNGQPTSEQGCSRSPP